MSYRPLPKELTIKESKIEGLGLFAKEDIKAGSKLGISHNIVRGTLYRTPLGGFYNHSEAPNLEKEDIKISEELTVFHLKTTKDVKAGEELTGSYTLYNV